MKNKYNSKNFNCYEDFEKFIKDNGIKTLKEFRNQFENLYNKYINLKSRGKISKEKELPLVYNRQIYTVYGDDWKKLSTFQKYINDNNIKSPKEFSKINSGLYQKMYREGYERSVIYPGLINYHFFDSLEKIQEFIYVFKIISRKDFKNRFISIYRRYTKLRSLSDRDVYFYKSELGSTEEKIFKELIVSRGITKIISQFFFNEFIKNKKPYRYDFYLPEYNTIVEVNGRQHFNKSLCKEIWGYEGDIVEDDRNKNEYAKSKGYEVRYFAFCKKEYDEFGYFDRVYFDIDEFIDSLPPQRVVEDNVEMLSIDVENLSDFEKFMIVVNKFPTIDREVENRTCLIEKIVSEEDYYESSLFQSVGDINYILQKFRITDAKQFEKSSFYKLYCKSQKYGWLDDLEYYCPDDEIIKVNQIKKIDKMKWFVEKYNISSKSDFRNRFPRHLFKAWKMGWLSEIDRLYFKNSNRRKDIV